MAAALKVDKENSYDMFEVASGYLSLEQKVSLEPGIRNNEVVDPVNIENSSDSEKSDHSSLCQTIDDN